MIGRVQPVEFLRAKDVNSVTQLVEYASQRIGCAKPIGHKARGVALKRISDEMVAQGWSVNHLLAAVDYMRSKRIRPRSFDFIFYHVEPALKAGFMKRSADSGWDALEGKVTEAVYLETDPDWTRRLLSARGMALQQVYENWVTERGGLLQ